MWDTIQDVARNMTLFLDKSREGHRICPRCKGSGLLENPFTRLEKSVAPPNQPCWFCEGVGALPIAGLNGFVLARATPCLQARDQDAQPDTQFLQPYHHKSREKTCSFARFKSGVNLADMVYDFSSTPSWLSHKRDSSHYSLNSLECQPNTQHEKWKTKEDFPGPSVPKQRLHSHSRFSMHPILTSEYSHYLSRIAFDPSTSNELQPNSMHVVSSNRSGEYIFPADGLRGGYTSSALYTPEAYVSKNANQHLEMEFFGRSISRIQTQMAHGSGANATCVFNTGRRRPLRKARNRVREKAEKEALERARGIMRTLAECNERSGGFKPLINMQCREVTGSLQEAQARGGQSIPFSVAPRIACLTNIAVCCQSWFNGVISGGCKALIPHSKIW